MHRRHARANGAGLPKTRKRGNLAGSSLVNVGLNGPYDVETVRGSALADVPDDNAIAAAEEVAASQNKAKKEQLQEYQENRKNK